MSGLGWLLFWGCVVAYAMDHNQRQTRRVLLDRIADLEAQLEQRRR